MKNNTFIIVWDDGQGICAPMVWNAECDGSVCVGIGNKDRVALFTSRADARKAIDISAKWAALNKAQGKIRDDDFLGEFRKNIRVVPCEGAIHAK